MLSIHKINKSFGAKQVLFDIETTISKREIVGILGPNGAGKSTIMRIMTGYYFQIQAMSKSITETLRTMMLEENRLSPRSQSALRGYVSRWIPPFHCWSQRSEKRRRRNRQSPQNGWYRREKIQIYQYALKVIPTESRSQPQHWSEIQIFSSSMNRQNDWIQTSVMKSRRSFANWVKKDNSHFF